MDALDLELSDLFLKLYELGLYSCLLLSLGPRPLLGGLHVVYGLVVFLLQCRIIRNGALHHLGHCFVVLGLFSLEDFFQIKYSGLHSEDSLGSLKKRIHKVSFSWN
jgi:hypothetical protein